MRVIAGEYGGRRLKALSGDNTRPTTDKVKESIFNIIGPYFEGGICLDLFAGSGGLSIEAISRGMDKAYLFEKDYKAYAVIKENIAITKEEHKFHLIKGDSKKLLHRVEQAVDLIFFDPPYAKQTIVDDLTAIVTNQLTHEGTIVVCETDSQVVLPEEIAMFTQWKRVVYGTIAVAFYERKEG